MIESQRLLRKRPLFRTVIPQARDILVGALPHRQPRQRLVVKARHDDRLGGKPGRHVVRQAEQIRSDDECIEVRLPPPQNVEKCGRVNGMTQVLRFDVRRHSALTLQDGLHRLQVPRAVVDINGKPMDRDAVNG